MELRSTPEFEVAVLEESNGKRVFPKGKQPRRYQDRSKYGPHQNTRECERRVRQQRGPGIRRMVKEYGFDPLGLDEGFNPSPPATAAEIHAVLVEAHAIKEKQYADGETGICHCVWCVMERARRKKPCSRPGCQECGGGQPAEDRQDPPAPSEV